MKVTAKIIRFNINNVDIELSDIQDGNIVQKIPVRINVSHDIVPKGLSQDDIFELVITGQRIGKRKPINQCDGCQAKMRKKKGIHYIGTHPEMVCTAKRYR